MSKEKKVCPIMSKYIAFNPDEAGMANVDCLEERCAWWESIQKECSIALLGLEVATRLDRLDREFG